MNIDKLWQVIFIAVIVFILGLILIGVVVNILPPTSLTLIIENPFLHTSLLGVIFALIFSLTLLVVKACTHNKHVLGIKFAGLYALLYLPSLVFEYNLTNLFVAVIFPLLSYSLVQLIVKRTA